MCRRAAYLGTTSLISFALLILTLAGCRAKTAAPDPAAASQAGGVSGAALEAVEAYAAPPGADQALLSELKDELARVLSARLAADGGKITCVPPLGDVNRIADLAYVQPPSEPARLAWSYLSIGDYDQNGEVNVSDLTPLGANFGAVGPFGHEDVLSVIDGDNNGELNIGDVTPIGQHFHVQVAAYNVYASLDAGDYPPADDAPNGAGAILLDTVPLAGAMTPAGGRSLFTFEITAPVAGHIYWVRPNDGTTDGSPSNQIIAPGPPEWEHTWGGDTSDTLEAIDVDDDGNIYVAGSTLGFGVTGMDVLVLSFDPNGELRWTNTWGGDLLDWAEGIAVADGFVYVTGATSSYGVGGDDALLLRYETDGTFLQARTWGTATADEWGRGVAVDSAGGVSVVGRLKPPASPSSSFMLLRYSPVGLLDWSAVWGGMSYHIFDAVTLDAAEAIIAAGSYETGTGDMNIIVTRVLTGGTSDWVAVWDSNGNESAHAVAVGPEGNVYIAGITDGFSATHMEALLQCYDAAGTLQWSRTWGLEGSVFATALDVDENGDILVGGYTQITGLTPDGVLLLKYDSSGTLLWDRTWPHDGGVIFCSGLRVDGESVCLAGIAPNNEGAWEEIAGTSTGVAGLQPAGAVIAPPITPAEDSPEGTVLSPEGVLDTGGGSDDGLVIKTSAE